MSTIHDPCAACTHARGWHTSNYGPGRCEKPGCTCMVFVPPDQDPFPGKVELRVIRGGRA